MPELPEVETTRRGIEPHILNGKVTGVLVRQRQLRWPVPPAIEREMPGLNIRSVTRRGKYLLIGTDKGTALIHLGMSGNLRIVNAGAEVQKHDHVDITFEHDKILRFHDPRRFGCVLWHRGDVAEHPLLAKLGPEPLSDDFNIDYLFARSRNRTGPIKSFIMDSHHVVGVGNIYANEALFAAGINPLRKAGSISRKRYECLVIEIRQVLQDAIARGGTTLKDFVGGTGKPGYFQQELRVYGQEGKPCVVCAKPLQEVRLAQRSTVFCKQCQS